VKLIALLLPLLLVACASTPESVAYSTASPKGSADRAAASAQKMVGKPYKYGGASPSGFDCSGLILFSYRQAGVSLPHNTEQQRRVAQRVKLAELKRGDLLFFDQEGKKHSHVGIYLGERRFVHAPSSGKHVRNDSLDSPYWKKHLSEVRRLAT
jgi:cell wall-associated NlpC family hydrolase